MAIVKMKRVRLLALASDREDLMARLQHLGCVEIEEPSGRLSDPQWAQLLSRGDSSLLQRKGELAEANTALEALRKYAGVSDGMFARRGFVTEEKLLSRQVLDEGKVVCDKINGLLQEISRLQAEQTRLEAKQASLEPWRTLDLPLETQSTQTVLVRYAVCPAGEDVGQMRNALATSDGAAELWEISTDREQHYLLLLIYRADEAAVMEALRPFGVSLTGFKDITGTAADNLAQIKAALEANEKRQKDALAEIAGEKENSEKLHLYADRLTQEVAREGCKEQLLTDGTILFLEGWAPAESMEELEKLFAEKGCAWEAQDPTEEEIPQVPVKLKNNPITRALNMVTEMYSLPAYDGVDPNPLMAPFFILFYGIMMADMGYGLLMMIASVVVLRRCRPKGTMNHFFSLLGLCGISTFIWGAITGGFFGDFLTQLVGIISPGTEFALPALFTPLNDTLMILIGAMALGFVQILTGMAISFVEKLKRGEVMDAIWEEVTWWVVFVGAALAILGVTPIVLVIGCVMVVAGPVVTGKGFGKITGIFGSLYNHITGYFGDILSYSRLMALMLAGSVIAQVFNTLGAIPGNVVVFFIISLAGNALNFALNLLGCYVHDLRLQCLEYFGKFYKDGGKPFKPLEINTKYVDIVKD